ncbi:MAG: formylglycine-generating enzyme family protein [Geminicoccaceae bacterium]
MPFKLACILAVMYGPAALATEAPAFIDVPGDWIVVGDPEGEPDEIARKVRIKPFRLMRHEVTNRAFADFVDRSGHRTDAETSGRGYVWTGRWQLIAGADWRHPFGPETSIFDRDDHPVVQVSANDAEAFCTFHGWRLPSEDEWEYAARGGDRRRYPWGDLAPEQGLGVASPANFGTVACCAADAGDGYLTTAPVGSFAEGLGPFGHADLAGNVWEWTASRFPGRPDHVVLRGGGWGNNPYCLRTAYRHGNPPTIGLDMVGIRCAADSERWGDQPAHPDNAKPPSGHADP